MIDVFKIDNNIINFSFALDVATIELMVVCESTYKVHDRQTCCNKLLLEHLVHVCMHITY